jgi:hypothetical protein
MTTPALTRDERRAANKAAWAAATAAMQQATLGAATPEGATTAEKRAARTARRQARAARDAAWASATSVYRPRKAGGTTSACTSPTPSVSLRIEPVPTTPTRRRVAAVDGVIATAWASGDGRPLPRSERSRLNRQAWADLQEERLVATQTIRAARRGQRRGAASLAWTVQQTERLRERLQILDGAA